MSNNKIWRVVPFYKTYSYWLGTISSIVLFLVYRRNSHLPIAIFMGASFALIAFINSVAIIKTTDTNLAVTRGFGHKAVKWDDILEFSINKSCITLKTKEDKKVVFLINRLLDKEEFLAFVESKIVKMN